MIELSRKKLLDLANELNAVDVTRDNKEREGFRRWNLIAYSHCVYGVSAKLFVDRDTSTYYVVKDRSSAIFMY